MRYLLVFLLVFTSHLSIASTRIVSLAPHLTEWVYSLGEEERLVAVSAYSDYPEEAQKLPIVADYQGVNLVRFLQYEPTLVLAWEDGNKSQDIARIRDMNIPIFLSNPQKPEDIAKELRQLGELLNKQSIALRLTREFEQQILALRQRYVTGQAHAVFYYSWQNPLMTIGKDAWGSELLGVCGARSIFDDSMTDYPTVSIQQVILKQPDTIVSVAGLQKSEVKRYWAPHSKVLSAKIVTANPDILSRFTLRLPNELRNLCSALHSQ